MAEDDIARRLVAAGVTAVSDALDKLSIHGQAVGITPVARGMRFAGRAYTVRMVPVGESGGVVGDYVDDVPPGGVVVIDNGGRLDQTMWGDILTFVASTRGIAGTVIDGVCRDSDRCVELNYPVFARAVTMRTGKDRATAEAYNVPVQIAGVRVDAGDWLVGDSDGVVAIPSARIDEVVRVAEEIEAAEDRIRAAVAAGARLDDARKAAGYHQLQTALPS